MKQENRRQDRGSCLSLSMLYTYNEKMDGNNHQQKCQWKRRKGGVVC